MHGNNDTYLVEIDLTFTYKNMLWVSSLNTKKQPMRTRKNGFHSHISKYYPDYTMVLCFLDGF